MYGMIEAMINADDAKLGRSHEWAADGADGDIVSCHRVLSKKGSLDFAQSAPPLSAIHYVPLDNCGMRWGGSVRGRRLRVTAEQIESIERSWHEGEKIARIARATELSRPTVYRVLAECNGSIGESGAGRFGIIRCIERCSESVVYESQLTP
jgi:hypothetical protein